MPEPMAVMNRPAIIGSISRPELAAEVPEAICRNVGMKAMAENMPRPIAAPSAVATTKVGLPNRDSGMIGCTARCSTSTKASTETAKAAIRARVQPSVQPRSPPKSVKKTSEVVPAEALVVGQVAADQRAGDGGQAEDRAERAEVLAALPGRDDVGDDRLRQDHQPAAAQALHAAPDHEPGEVGGQGRADAGGGEQRDREQE